jgi:DNA-binding NtrC family response regulator
VHQPRTVALPHLSPQLPVRTLHVAVVDGPDRGATLAAEGDRIRVGTATGNDLVLHDETVSGYHLDLTGLDGGIRVVDNGSTNGTRAGPARLQDAVVDPGTLLQIGRTQLRVSTADRAFVELHPEDALGELRGRSAVMRRLMAQIKRVAPSEVAVLLVGESGTGKELIAQALHERSARAGGPFVTVDCGALAPSLVASELFGHERGAFTGADRRRLGAFERAQGGTVFLDEIGELSGDLQASLLGVLERRRIHRVGGDDEIAIDVRVLSATNRDLRREVNAGSFRLDLFYRLAVVNVEVPPLRERSDDIAMLVEHFLRECGAEGPLDRYFSPDMIHRLEEHRWPGNVRELRNLVEATIAMGEPVSPSKLSVPPPAEDPVRRPPRPGLTVDLDLPYKEARAQLLEAFEKKYLLRALERAGGNVSQAARAGRLTRSHLSELLRKHGIRGG